MYWLQGVNTGFMSVYTAGGVFETTTTTAVLDVTVTAEYQLQLVDIVGLYVHDTTFIPTASDIDLGLVGSEFILDLQVQLK